MAHKLLVIIALFFCTKSSGQIKKYDFSFENRDQKQFKWLKSSNNSIIGIDTTDYIDGKSSLCFLGRKFFKSYDSYVFQTINLPIRSKNIELSIYTKSIIVDNAYLKLFCLDSDDNLLSKDSVKIISEGSWKKFTLKTENIRTQKIYIEISAKTKDTLIQDINIRQKFLADNISLQLDGCSIESLVSPSSNFTDDEIRNIKDSYSLNNNIVGLSMLNDFQSHSILAFGETVHGSKEIQEFTFDAIIQLIKNNNCKLVIFEVPFELSLRLNDFVGGNTQENIENLMLMSNMDMLTFKNFLNWVRQYNKQSSEKVTIAGLDENEIWQPEDNLVAFLKNIETTNNVVVDEILQNLESKNYEKAIQIVQSKMPNYYDQKIRKCIIHAINIRMNMLKPIPTLIEGDREYVQFQNAKFAIETFTKESEKTAIMAHLAHVNKKNNMGNRYYIRNLGSYISQAYLENYFVTAILIGNGTITSFDQNGYGNNFALITPPKESLEDLCMATDKNIFYKNLSSIKSKSLGRFIGSTYMCNQFYPFSHVGRFDGLVFIRNSSGNRLPESWPKTKEEITKYMLTQLKNNSR